MLPPESLIISMPLFLVTAWLMRKSLFGLFDPLLINIFALCSSVGLMFAYFNLQAFDNVGIIFVFILCHIAFIGGFRMGGRVRWRLGWSQITFRPSYLRVTLFVSVLLLILTMFIMTRTVGLGILQENPEVAKTTLTGGAGVFKRFLPAFTMIAFGLLLAVNNQSRVHPLLNLGVFAITVFAAISTGSRSALLMFYSMLVFRMVYLRRNFGIKPSKAHLTWLVVFAGFVMVVAIVIIAIGTANQYGVQGLDLLNSSLGRLIERIVGFGDIALFYFGLDVQAYLNKTPLDFINAIANVFLGPLRIVEYSVPLGAEMYSIGLNVPNESNFGPNAQLYFASVIYFGSLLGIIFSFLVGWGLAATRQILFRTLKRPGFDHFLFLCVSVLVLAVPQDITLALGNAFDWLMGFAITFLFSTVIYSLLYRRLPRIYQLPHAPMG